MSDSETIKKGGISVETEHIFPIIKKWLYSEKEIFLREIVSNACDAVTKYKRLVSLGHIEADENKKHLNINADSMASGIAAGLKCKEMIQITDVPGIMLDINDPSSKQNLLTLAQVDELIAKGVISGGMVPKVEACRKALNAGVNKVRMVNGKDPRSIVSDVMKSVEHGTIITK